MASQTTDEEVKGCGCLIVILIGLFAVIVFIVAAAVKWVVS
jgi:hypothetical protein